MDPNTKQSVVIEAVGSLANFGQLNPSTSGDGPIDRMPPEIMQMIMAKLELNGDVTNLVRLRSVSTKWKALVEDYFTQKKSLIVVVGMVIKHPKLVCLPPTFLPKNKILWAISPQQAKSFYFDLEKRYFDFEKLNNFARLVLANRMPPDCLRSLLKMFPNTVQLSISCIEPTLVPHLVDCISSLDSLTQLDLEGPFIPTLSYNARTSLSKLEHFSIDIAQLQYDYDYHHLVDHLEPCCARVCFKGHFPYDQVRQWHNLNPNWLAKLTHLFIETGHIDGPQIVHFLGEWATSLKYLNIIMNRRSDNQLLQMTPTVIRDLSKLTNLAELKLSRVSMDIRELTETISRYELTSIVFVLTCKLLNLRLVGDGPISGGQLTRVLSVIFPNLAELVLIIIIDRHFTQQFKHEFEHYSNRFPKLRNHNIYYI